MQEKHFASKFLIMDTFEIFNPMFHFRSYEVFLGEFKASESRPPQPMKSWSDTQVQIFKNQGLIYKQLYSRSTTPLAGEAINLKFLGRRNH